MGETAYHLKRLRYSNLVLFVMFGLAVWYAAWLAQSQHQTVKAQSDVSYQRAFFHLNDMLSRTQDEFENMELIHSTNGQKRYWAHVWRLSQMAQQDLAVLPLINQPMEQTQRFLHDLQTEAYKQAIHPNGKVVNSKVHDWYHKTKAIRIAMENVQANLWSGNDGWSELDQSEPKSKLSLALLDADQSGIQMLNAKPSASPKSTVRPTSNATRKQVSTTRLIHDAAYFMGKFNVSRSESSPWTRTDGESGCTLNDSKIRISFDQTCQHIRTFSSDYEPNKVNFSDNELKMRVLKMMNAVYPNNGWHIEKMQPNHHWITFRLVPDQDGIWLASDRIVVRASLDDGSVLSLDASAYLENHHQRKLPGVLWDQSAMQEMLDPQVDWTIGYDILRENEFGDEVRCLRWFGDLDGKQVQVDINTTSGEVEGIDRWTTSG